MKRSWPFCPNATPSKPIMRPRLQNVARHMTVKWWGDEFQVTATIAAVGAERSDTMESLMARVDARMARLAPAAGTPAIR